jgi:succinate-semialdehyde dehydrogenase/glutarate-semialdehyde dehydrogenase
MPWNYPLWQVIRFAAPCLLAGNAALLKHSPNVTGCALAIQRVFREAGLPVNVFRSLVVEESAVPEITQILIADSRVAAVSLTGSERAGMAIGAAAGRAVKKSVLELGGSDPFVVLADADVAAAAAAAVRSRFLNAGQSCLAAKRFIAHRSVVDQFTELFASGVDDLVVGDPTKASTQVGPMAREDLASDLRRQLASSVAAGARVRTRRTIEPSGGAWFTPTVVDAVTLDMVVMREETFGPLAAVFSVDDDAAAVRVSNATPYGLGASVWSRDSARALDVGRQITSGALFVNAVVASDPRLPFGGTKRSGYGRELGAEGAVEFTNVRTYVVSAGSQPASPSMA